jgi:adenosine deaminase
VSISTDGRVTTPVTLDEIYATLQKLCGWRQDELFACNAMAIRASFAPHETKALLGKRLYRAYEKRRGR